MKSIKSTSSQVNAILAGRKTQDRIVIKVQPENPNAIISRKSGTSYLKDVGKMSWIIQEKEFLWKSDKSKEFKIPYEIGDKIFVKEKWGVGTRPCPFEGWYDGIEYEADEELFCHKIDHDNLPEFEDVESFIGNGWKSAHSMPQWASRITLEITDIRVERLRDVGYHEADAEGIFDRKFSFNYLELGKNKINDFKELWNSIHKNKPEKSWESNPFVWVLTFKKI